jgi:ATP-binding cassette subfamily B protein
MVFGKHFVKYYLKYSYVLLIGVALLILIDWIQLDVPKYTGIIIDSIDKVARGVALDGGITIQALVNDIVNKIIVLVIVITVGRFIWRFLIFGTSRQVEYELRKVMFDHALLLNQTYYSTHKVGAIMTYFVNDIAAIREAFGPGLLTLTDGVFLGVFAIYRMYILNPTITYISIVPIILTLFIIITANSSLRKKFRLRQDSYEKLSEYIQESYSGIGVVKAFVREVYKIVHFDKKSDDFQDKSINYLRKMITLQVVVSIAINLVALLIMTVGVLLIVYTVNSDIPFTPGQLAEYISYYTTLLWPLNAITRFLYLSSQANASSKRMTEFLDAKEDDVNAGELIDNLSGDIRFDHLTFRHQGATFDSLIDVTLDIKEGEFIGLIGRTGSGKTTLVELLAKIYPVPENKVFVGGHDIATVNVKSIRDVLGYVPQDNFLYSDTIGSNIAFSSPEKKDDVVSYSAKLADIDTNIIDFKEQYNTVLGERGVTVSGGQKQRISIARALYKNPKILILDDSVSAVDINTEEIIINNLMQSRKGKTTILIAHRTTTIKRLDKILVLDEGRVVGFGSYNELLSNSKIFQDIVKLQELEEKVNVHNSSEVEE